MFFVIGNQIFIELAKEIVCFDWEIQVAIQLVKNFVSCFERAHSLSATFLKNVFHRTW